MKKKAIRKKEKESEPIIFPDWKKFSRYSTHIIILITFGALIVRAYRVGFLTIWLDEYMHINPAMSLVKGHAIVQGDINGIFLTWVVTLFFKLFGITETFARIPSVLFGAASVPLIYYFGKKLYNKSIGTMAAILGAFSLYLICWSRLARNYASFEFSYLILLIVLWLTFNTIYSKTKNKNGFLEKNGINRLYLIILPFAFIFSFLNHQLTFFSLFGLSIYMLIIAIKKINVREPGSFLSTYSILSYIIIIGIIVFLTPVLLDKIARPVLDILLPERIINWVMPDWDFIIEQLKLPEKRLKSFMVYFNVIRNDYTRIYYLSLLGIISSFFIPNKRKEAAFLFSMFVVPLLLMSFVFREPSTPNYLYYLYPIFLIYIAIFIFFFVKRILPLIASKSLLSKKWFSNFSLALIVILLFISIPKKEIKSLINTKEHGQVIKKELFHTSFINWKDVCNQIKPYIKKQDAVISTWVNATNFYLKRDNSIWFRQRYYDTEQRKYVNYESLNNPNSARSLEDLQQTFIKNKTGWLFADYYFDNVLTDPRARDFVIRNMDYHFSLGKDGEVKVFSWDHNRKKRHTNSLIIELGKSDRKQASKELNFNIETLNSLNKGLVIIIDAEGIDQQNEAYVMINQENYTIFNTPNQNGINANNSARRDHAVLIHKSWLKEGQNTMQFGYNSEITDYPKGYVIYNIKFQNQ